ncbi:MAG: hypothetical protein CVT84_08930 [Alphaproteobacteria bacterium HGW-Alphaproteobacteria-6]|nr:MAG: hypothetical protein CVT84_08930 [Alphaproteobacteria bacterium HGW-Alphaproteobacteria-6]
MSNTARNPYDFDSNYARASVASGQIWAQVPADALAWEKGEDPLATPLWPLSEPEWFRVANAEMRARWRDQFPELCGFWLRWWDGVVSGRQIDWTLQEKVALIPDEIWDHGPAAVAAEIARIEAEHGYVVSEKSRISAVRLMKASLAKFRFDELRRLMKMVPFSEDIAFLRDGAVLRRFLVASDAMRLKLETLSAAFEAEGRTMQGAGSAATYLKAVLEELSRARQLEELNVGWVIDCGEILQTYVVNEDARAEFGVLHGPLANAVASLLDLTTSYFAETFLRCAPLKDIRSNDETSLFDLMEDLRRGLRAIEQAPRDDLVPLAPEDRAVFLALLEDVERTIRAEFVASTPAVRSSLRRDADYRLAQIAVSLLLYIEEGKNAAKKSERVLQIAGTIDRGYGALEKLVKWLMDHLP